MLYKSLLFSKNITILFKTLFQLYWIKYINFVSSPTVYLGQFFRKFAPYSLMVHQLAKKKKKKISHRCNCWPPYLTYPNNFKQVSLKLLSVNTNLKCFRMPSFLIPSFLISPHLSQHSYLFFAHFIF